MTTPIARNISSIPVALIEANEIDWGWFVRVDVASPVGTKRFCDRAADYTGAIEATSATWLCGSDLRVGAIDQGREFTLQPSNFSVSNLDYTWSNWAQSPGISDAPVEIYVGWFNADGSLAGAVKLYHGRIDNHGVLSRAELALKPWVSEWARRALRHVPGMSPRLAAPLAPKDGDEVRWETAPY